MIGALKILIYFLLMILEVGFQVGQQAEGLATLGTAVAFHLGVGVERERVWEGLETQGALMQVFGVGLLVVEEGGGVTVRAPTQVTLVALVSPVLWLVCPGKLVAAVSLES